MMMPYNPDTLRAAIALLGKGEVVAFPTETVYGLGGDASNEEAVQKIFSIKGRPSFNPLIVHVLDLAWAQKIAIIPEIAYPLLARYWPGPLTIVVPLLPQASLAPSVTAGLKTVGLRVPKHPMFREILASYGKPIAAPSANASNTLSCTTAAHVEKSLRHKVPLILQEETPCQHGLESTIVDFSSSIPVILRQGAIAQEDIEKYVEILRPFSQTSEITSPGQMKRHYAPGIPLRLNALFPEDGEAFLNFGASHPQESLNLSPSSNLEEAGHNLFHMLHTLDDETKFSAIAVAPIPHDGLGSAINDRLQRAAAREQGNNE
jgi:L-threonylcarbamoyladenylate synthase